MRRRRNSIEFIKDLGGRWLNSWDDIGKAFVANFSNLFSSSNPAIPDSLDNLISPVISLEENEWLCSIPQAEEIWEAIKHLGDHKAPGLDGLTALFYKKYWHIIKKDVVAMVKKCVSDGFPPSQTESY